MIDLHSIITSFSYVAIFILMILNGAVNFPSSQLLYIVCGYFVSTGTLLFIPVVIVGALGNTLGNTVTYFLVKKYEHTLARKLLMMDEKSFSKIHSALHATFARRGMWWIFLGKLTPSVKAFIVIIAALANTKPKLTIVIFLSSSLIWATGVTALGFFFGEQFSMGSFATVSFIVGISIMYILYKKVYKQVSIK